MITQRQQSLLEFVIDDYVNTGEPVSSKNLEKSGFFGLSSATIRSEMNDLESLGYLAHLYTSSGRVPTEKAYRYFVDNLLSWDECEVDKTSKKRVQSALADADPDPRRINKLAAKVVSDLSDNLVITTIYESDDFFKTGLASLLNFPEFKELDRIFKLTSFFDEFELIFNQLSQRAFSSSHNQTAIKIFIGGENQSKEIKKETSIFARYSLPGHYTGSMTIIGPMRMDYRKNIGLVKYIVDSINELAE